MLHLCFTSASREEFVHDPLQYTVLGTLKLLRTRAAAPWQGNLLVEKPTHQPLYRPLDLPVPSFKVLYNLQHQRWNILQQYHIHQHAGYSFQQDRTLQTRHLPLRPPHHHCIHIRTACTPLLLSVSGPLGKWPTLFHLPGKQRHPDIHPPAHQKDSYHVSGST